MNDIINPEIMTPSALESATRAEYDISIVTAHRFPRSINAFMKRAESLATATPEIASSMQFAKPVGGGKVVGESVRLAEVVAATYGNLRVQARIISETQSEVVAQGIAHDLETNVAHSTEITMSILKKDGSRFGPDQVATVRAAACAKARRNAIFLVVPKAICAPIAEAARKVAAGTTATLPERREKQISWFESKGVKRATVFAWLGVKGIEDIGLEEMADMIAASNSAKEEGISLQELFSKPKEGNPMDALKKDETK